MNLEEETNEKILAMGGSDYEFSVMSVSQSLVVCQAIGAEAVLEELGE